MDDPTRKTTYGGGLALAYDALMREDYSYPRYADYIAGLFYKYGPPPEPIIADLGCGTGSMCAELAARGYDVIGIDNSPQMLAEARRKAADRGDSNILFLEQELDAIDLYGTVGAFVSTIDSVNYLTDKRRLRRLFKLVSNYLQPGGLFVFDVNTEYKMQDIIGNGVFYEITDDICYLWKSNYVKSDRVSTFDLTFFIRGAGGGWDRFDEIHRQRAYSLGDFQEAARGTGLEFTGLFNFLSYRKPSDHAAKINYVLQKLTNRS